MLTEEQKKELIASIEESVNDFELRYQVCLNDMDRYHIWGVDCNDPSLWNDIERCAEEWARDYAYNNDIEDEEEFSDEVCEYINEYYN